MMVHNMKKNSESVTFTSYLSGLYFGIIVAVQTTASALFSTAEINAGCSGTLQCTDIAITRSSEAWTDVHGHQ